jgi:predicted MFS family arabinose efflux permease
VAGQGVAAAPKSAGISVWRNRDFRLIWLGNTVSQFGSGITQVAYPLLVLTLTGSPAIAGLVSAARALPYVLFGLPAGALIDRWNLRKVMIVCDACRAVNMATIPVTIWLGRLTAAQLIITAFAGGVCFVFFSAAEETALPNIVAKEQFTAAVSAQETSASAGGIVVPALGGGLLTVSSFLPFLADGLSFLASVICLSFVRTSFRQGSRPDKAGSLWFDITEGLRWLWRHSALRLIAIVASGLQLAISGVSLIVIVAARHAGASSVTIGILFSAVGVGGVLGALIVPWLKTRLSIGGMLLTVMWLEAALWFVLAASKSLIAIGVVIVFFVLSMPIFGIASLSYRLAITPDHLRGRVGTAFSLLIWGTTPVGATVSGVLLDKFSPQLAALVFGGWVVVLSVIASAGGLRHLDRRVAEEDT